VAHATVRVPRVNKLVGGKHLHPHSVARAGSMQEGKKRNLFTLLLNPNPFLVALSCSEGQFGLNPRVKGEGLNCGQQIERQRL